MPGVAGQMQRVHVPAPTDPVSSRKRRSAAFMNRIRSVEAAVKARKTSDGTSSLPSVTTHLELGRISPANKCQRGSEDRSSLLSMLDEQATVSVQQAAFEALPSALQREQVVQPEQTAPVNSDYPIVEPECAVLDASRVSNTMAVPASGNVCVIAFSSTLIEAIGLKQM